MAMSGLVGPFTGLRSLSTYRLSATSRDLTSGGGNAPPGKSSYSSVVYISAGFPSDMV
jgi:hypothetical protein